MTTMALEPKFILARYPEWYSEDGGHEEAYTCLDTRGLFKAVRDMMVDGQRRLSVMEKRCRPQVVYKKIREEVIKEAEALRQKPSRSLLLALMDLVEVLGGNEFGSVATADRAGLRHVLLIYGNYTAYYIPNEELRKPRRNRTVIPVVTQYSGKHNLVRYDARRSMVGTYSVVIPNSENDSRRSYFVQEALFTPGRKSLNLLKETVGTMFEFWDMALEMPTHIRALAPSFRQIQPCQLLLSDEPGSPAGDEQSERDALASHLEEIQPMCCAPVPPDEGSWDDRKTKREASVDCFSDSQVKCDLTRFQYDKDHGEARAVYFRRSGKVLDGKRGNLLPVVALRKDQDKLCELYVSTTLRFYRALKRSCVKGNGVLMSCWNETLQDLGRDTFISGEELCQEIQQSALTAFTRRVNPGGWCNGVPRHVESTISNPVMIEVVELAIALMEGRIPSAFAVAELLYCPIERVRTYLGFQHKYDADPEFRAAVRNKRAGLIAAQMWKDRTSLADLVALYGKKKERSGDTACKAVECAEMLRQHHCVDINKIQKLWYTLSRGDSAKEKDVYANVKVLFLKLRVYHNKLKKLQIPGEQQRSHDTSHSSCDAKETDDTRGDEPSRVSPDRRELSCDNVRKRALDPDGVADRGEAYEREEDVQSALESAPGRPPRVIESALYVTPEATPVSHWIKNMSTLLLSDPWLNGDGERRDAVSVLLRLDETLLNRAHSDILGEWVASNRGVVSILAERGLRDRLSAALIDRSYSLSTDRWVEKALVAFPDEAGRRMPSGAPRGGMSTLFGHTAASSAMSELQNSRSGAERSERRYPGEGKRQSAGADPRGQGVVKKVQTPCRRSGPTAYDCTPKGTTDSGFTLRNPWSKRDRDRTESMCLSEAEEASCDEDEDPESEMELEAQGEDLASTAQQDEEYMSGPDEYDYSDGFIDDGSLGTGSTSSSDSSSGSDGDGGSGEEFCSTTNGRKITRGVGGRGPRSELGSGRPLSRRGLYSDPEEDSSYSRRNEAPGPRYKHPSRSDDSDADGKERILRPSRRVKKRKSPDATPVDVDERHQRGEEPARRGCDSESEEDGDYDESVDEAGGRPIGSSYSRRNEAPGPRYKHPSRSDDSDGDYAEGKERIVRPRKRVKNRKSPDATPVDVDERHQRGEEPSRRGCDSELEEDDDYAESVDEAGDRLIGSSYTRRNEAPGPRYKHPSRSDDSDGDYAEGKERVLRPSKRVKKRKSPDATPVDVDERQQRAEEPATLSSGANSKAGVKSKAAAAAAKSLGRKHHSLSKRRGSWDVRKDVSNARGVSSSHVKKTQGGKADQIKSSPEQVGLSASQASTSGVTRWTNSSPSKKRKGACAEEGCRRRNSPAAERERAIGHRPKKVPDATSGSDSGSQERQGSPDRKPREEPQTGYRDASTKAQRSTRRAWFESEDEVGSERGESEDESDAGPTCEQAKRTRRESCLPDSYAETKEREEDPGSRDQAGVARKVWEEGIESEEESSASSGTQHSDDEDKDEGVVGSDTEPTGDASYVITM